MTKQTEISITKITIIFVSLIYLSNFVSGGTAVLNYGLIPKLVLKNYELWRIFTYPLSITSFESYLLFVVTFYFYTPKLEKLFPKNAFLMANGLLSILFGLISTFIFAANNYIFSGFEHISLFVLLLHTFLNIKNKVNLVDDFYVPYSYLTLSIITTWIFFKTIGIMFVGGSIVAHLFYPLIFAVLTSVTFYLRIIFINKTKIKEEVLIPNFQSSTKEEFEHAYVSQDEVRKIVKKIEDDFIANYELEEELNEENLNGILDKINEFGRESLTESENYFLERYSRTL